MGHRRHTSHGARKEVFSLDLIQPRAHPRKLGGPCRVAPGWCPPTTVRCAPAAHPDDGAAAARGE